MPQRNQAFIYDWRIVKWPEIEYTKDSPENAFGFLDRDGHSLALYGRVLKDYREDAETGEFADGHRIITSDLYEYGGGVICTKNTAYTLGEINPPYAEWCAENGYDIENAVRGNITASRVFDASGI
jgi:hypothetical protein